jgi:hypothetical protein
MLLAGKGLGKSNPTNLGQAVAGGCGSRALHERLVADHLDYRIEGSETGIIALADKGESYVTAKWFDFTERITPFTAPYLESSYHSQLSGRVGNPRL